MARFKRKKRSSHQGILMIWLIVGVVGAWGVWNAMKLQETMRGNGAGASKRVAALPLMWVQTATAQSTADPFSPGASESQDNTQTEHAANGTRPLLSQEELATLLSSGNRALDGGHIVAGRDLLNQALAGMTDETRQDELRRRLADMNVAAFLGTEIPQGDPYVKLTAIAPGDSFLRLGHQYKVPAEFIARINPQLSARNLQPGSGLKVVFGPFHIRIIKHTARLDLYARNMYVNSYNIGFDEGNYLPPGIYRVAPGGKIALGDSSTSTRRWVMCEGVADEDGATVAACIYGSAGPRATGRYGLSGIHCSDEVLDRVYNTLIEQESLMRVDP